MVVDASALLAILFAEIDAQELTTIILSSSSRRISVINLTEAAIVADHDKGGRIGGVQFDEFVRRLEFSIEPVTLEQTTLARSAYRRFGKGNHPARLNLGDCFAYALSKATGEPLLFKGGDFAATDVERVT